MKHAEKIGYDVWFKVSSDENTPFTLLNERFVYTDFKSAVKGICDSVWDFVYSSEYDEIKNMIVNGIKLNEEYVISSELYSIDLRYVIRENDYGQKQLELKQEEIYE